MDFVDDLRRALRTLRRSPGYALTCVAVLALGIGANAAIFSVAYAVVFHALPYPDVPRLVFIWESVPNMPDPPGGRLQVAYQNFKEWKRQGTSFSEMAAYFAQPLEETGALRGKVSAGFATPELFSMLGVHAQAGRLFTTEPGRVAVLGDEYFESRFQHDSGRALGHTLTLGGDAYTVIGVLPRGFHVPATWQGSDQVKADLWTPLAPMYRRAEDESQRQLLVTARLKNGVTLDQARAEMLAIAERLSKTYPKLDDGWRTSVYPFEVEDASPALHRTLYVLLAAAGFMLLIACANLANLTLARAMLRSREIAVRLAIGATRGRILSQLVAESFVVSMAGAVVGVTLAYWCVHVLLALKPPDIQRPELIEINLPVLAFAAVAGVVTTILFGLAPSLTASKADLMTVLKSGAWGSSASRLRSRQFLILVEVAMALVLVTGAGLMIRSFRQLADTGIGFDARGLIAADLRLPDGPRYASGESRSRFFRQLIERVKAIPGVMGASTTDALPLHTINANSFNLPGQTEQLASDTAHISPDFFPLIGLKVEAGRLFTKADLALSERDGATAMIVNHAFAGRYFPGQNPIGKRLEEGDKKRVSEIVGVVSDFRPMGVEEGTRPERFWPYMKLQSASLLVKTGMASPQSLGPAITEAVRSMDSEVDVAEVRPLEDRLANTQAQRKFNTLVFGLLAGLATVLATIGIYGVLANMVASSVREIGIRMAIGAPPAAITKLVLQQGMLPVAVGLAIGMAGALAMSQFVEALLFAVKARDPLTLMVSAALIAIASCAALLGPLRRALRVDCTVALREE